MATYEGLTRRIQKQRELRQEKAGFNPRAKQRIQKLRRQRRGLTPDPNPRPPNEPRPKGKGADNQAGSAINEAIKGRVQGSTSDKSLNQAYKQGMALPNDPRDDTYWRQIVDIQNKRNTELAQLDLEQTFNQTAYEDALQALARNEPLELLAERQRANRGGAIFSSATADQLARIAGGYAEQRGGLQREKQREDAMREFMRAAIENGASSDEAAALAEAADRAAQGSLDQPLDLEGIDAIIARLFGEGQTGQGIKKSSFDKRIARVRKQVKAGKKGAKGKLKKLKKKAANA